MSASDEISFEDVLQMTANDGKGISLRLNRWTMPDDVLGWLNEAEESIRSLPDEVRQGFSVTFERIGMAREFHQKGLQNKLKRTCYRILQDLENARSDLDSHEVAAIRVRQREKSKKSRREKTLDSILDRLASKSGAYSTLWEQFETLLENEPKFDDVKPVDNEKLSDQSKYTWVLVDGEKKQSTTYGNFRKVIRQKQLGKSLPSSGK